MIYRCTRCDSGLVYQEETKLLYCKFCGSYYSAELCTEADLLEMTEEKPQGQKIDHYTAGRPQFNAMNADVDEHDPLFGNVDVNRGVFRPEDMYKEEDPGKAENLFEEPENLFKQRSARTLESQRKFHSEGMKATEVFHEEDRYKSFYGQETSRGDGYGSSERYDPLPRFLPRTDGKPDPEGALINQDSYYEQAMTSKPSISLASIESAFASATNIQEDRSPFGNSYARRGFSSMEFNEDDFDDDSFGRPNAKPPVFTSAPQPKQNNNQGFNFGNRQEKSEPVATPQPQTRPEPKIEITPQVKPEPVATPVQQYTPEPVATPVQQYTPEPVIEVTPEPVIEVTPEPVIEVTPEPVIEVTPEPVIEVAPEPVIEVTPEPVIEVKAEPEVKPAASAPKSFDYLFNDQTTINKSKTARNFESTMSFETDHEDKPKSVFSNTSRPQQPVTPVQPVASTQPVAPVQPVVSTQPVTPVQPVAPAQPVTPVQPVAPAQRVTPAQPVAPVQPAAPAKPATSAPKSFDHLFDNPTQTNSMAADFDDDPMVRVEPRTESVASPKLMRGRRYYNALPDLPGDPTITEQKDMDMRVFYCNTCGGRVMVPSGEVSPFCSFCGDNTVVFDRNLTLERPKRMLPFKLTPEQAKNVIIDRLGYSKFSLDEVKFLDVENVHGVYVPYWIYQTKISRSMTVTVNREVPVEGPTAKKGQVEVKETDYSRQAEDTVYVYLPACKSLNDVMAERVAPYNLDKLTRFSVSGMKNFYASRYDVVANQRLEEAHMTAQMLIDEEILDQCPGVKRDEKDPERVANVKKKDVKEEYEVVSTEYIMLPTYFVAVKYNNHSYNVIVNGQTGKIVSNLPLNQSKVKQEVVKMGVLTGLVYSMLCFLFTSVYIGSSNLAALLVLPLGAVGFSIFKGIMGKKKYDENYYRMQLSKVQKYAEERNE